MTTIPPATDRPAPPDRAELIEMVRSLRDAGKGGKPMTAGNVRAALLKSFPAARVDAALGCSMLYLLGCLTVADLLALGEEDQTP